MTEQQVEYMHVLTLITQIENDLLFNYEHDQSIIHTHRSSSVQCGVCHDKATGIHYGLATCEGCKGNIICYFVLTNI
jgi:hypothetical protein